MSNNLTVQDIAEALPSNLKGAANQQLADLINNVCQDPEVAEHVRNNFMSYTRVLQEGKFKVEDYLNAVVFVSYRLGGLSNQEAWQKTFPQRHAALVAKGTSAKDISSHVSMYSRGKLVNAILEKSLVPFWVLNQDARQKALNVQIELMMGANSEMVRMQAANSVLVHTDKPKDTAAAVQITINESDGMAALKKQMNDLALTQIRTIEGGVSPKDVAALPLIIDGESQRV
ncbi:terminase small subunit [Stenotrophomonas phage Philippe]|uniref:Terminase small subunit n=1 Tax=Stenotrophomonas phage Philippe TaxID=2859655 RepID=A0AAE8BI55_9CAUD|nr:terminase small subunit [Stenotrophomonas phage Philippe]QYW02290.1 terminase small subunit [Stenotrophomonas phage Philippe]